MREGEPVADRRVERRFRCKAGDTHDLTSSILPVYPGGSRSLPRSPAAVHHQ
jgi:hypothetical protein